MRKSLLVLAVAVFLWQVYRAAVTAVTPIEATMFTRFASRPFPIIIASPFDPANQILHTILVARFVRMLRLTEFTLRLASLLGFATYLLAVFRISRVRRWGWLASAVCILNPFSLGWLPISTGIWMALALFLFAVQNLMDGNLRAAVLQLGLAVGFDLAFLPVSLFAVGLLSRRGLFKVVNEYILPIFLISLGLWGLTILRTPLDIWRSAVVLWSDTVVLISVFAAFVVANKANWRLLAMLTILLIAIEGALANFAAGTRNCFRVGPEAGLPRVSRALRDDIRRNQIGVVKVAVSDPLQRTFDFYRRRYALGAVDRITDMGSANYWIALDSDVHFPAGSGATRIFQRDGISLFRRD